MFYTETAGAAFPSARDGFDNQMRTLQQRASELKWQEARGCHKHAECFFFQICITNRQLIRKAES